MTDDNTELLARQARMDAAKLRPAPRRKLGIVVRDAQRAYAAMAPEQRATMKRQQRESFIRAMTTPCEHGVLDFEDCAECRRAASVA